MNEVKNSKQKRILSGIQPSGMIHLGNYYGAMKQYLDFQDSGNECLFFIANYHAMTSIKDAVVLKDNTLDVAMKYLAIGLNKPNVFLFKQSDVPEVTELSWFFSTVTPMGLLERCHSYKDKISHGVAPEHGLFAYPVLMAADILIYKSDIVPVGKDQKQHVEVTRDIAIKFNNLYGNILTIPDVKININTAVVPGIDGRKMSKSYNNIISPFAPEKELKKQISSIVTDSTPLEEPKNPDSCNVFALYKLLADEKETEEMKKKYLEGGYGYGHAKKALLEKLLDHFKDARKEYDRLKNDKGYVLNVLKQGSTHARELATQTMDVVRKAVGIV